MNLSTFIARIGPWLVSLAPAWLIYDSLTTSLHIPNYIAALVAAGVELTGIAAFDTYLWLRAWNKNKRASDPLSPAQLSLIPVVVYLTVGVILTAVLKSKPVLALFFLLAGAGYSIIALQSDQTRREAEVKAGKAEAKAERQQRKAKRPPERSTNNERPPQPLERSPEFDELIRTVAEQFERSAMSSFGQANVQEWTGQKRTTAYKLLGYGQNTGVIEQVGRGKFICVNGRKPDDE